MQRHRLFSLRKHLRSDAGVFFFCFYFAFCSLIRNFAANKSKSGNYEEIFIFRAADGWDDCGRTGNVEGVGD